MKNIFDSIPKFIWPFLIFLAIGGISLFVFFPVQEKEEVALPKPPELFSSSYIQIGTGNPLGTYFPVGKILAEWFNKQLNGGNELFRSVETNGSIGNIELLNEKRISFCMAECRIGSEFFEKKKKSELRIVWPLWPDVVQIICASETTPDITELANLPGFLGQKNSSTFRTSSEIFSIFGIDWKKSETNIQTSMVVDSLKDSGVAFATIQAGIPNLTVSDALLFNNCKLLSFSDDQVKRLLSENQTFQPAIIPEGYYGENQKEIHTVGILNAFFSNATVSDKTVEDIVELLVKGAPYLEIKHKATSAIPTNLSEAYQLMKETKIPIHQGTLNYLKRSAPELFEVKNVDE